MREHADEAIGYLEASPVQTTYMRGLICDHGVVDARNRGDFYACRDGRDGGEGRICGVALLGDAILFASDDRTTTDALASFARDKFTPRLIRGERDAVNEFWQIYAGGRNLSHAATGEHLLVMREPIEAGDSFDASDDNDDSSTPSLREATMEDLPLLMSVNAGLLRAEGGRDPRVSDPAGFCRRLAQRIERGRVWVWREGARLIFKMDLLSETPQAIYVEGIYVAPEWRGRGVGLRCVTEIGRTLLKRTAAVCLTVRQDNERALTLYHKAGFQFHSEHATIYLQPSQQTAAA